MMEQSTTAVVIDSLRELALRFEIDAAAYATLNSREAALLAEEMLERADGLRRLANNLEEARLRRGRP